MVKTRQCWHDIAFASISRFGPAAAGSAWGQGERGAMVSAPSGLVEQAGVTFSPMSRNAVYAPEHSAHAEQMSRSLASG